MSKPLRSYSAEGLTHVPRHSSARKKSPKGAWPRIEQRPTLRWICVPATYMLGYATTQALSYDTPHTRPYCHAVFIGFLEFYMNKVHILYF
jgi:hypothetical protein